MLLCPFHPQTPLPEPSPYRAQVIHSTKKIWYNTARSPCLCPDPPKALSSLPERGPHRQLSPRDAGTVTMLEGRRAWPAGLSQGLSLGVNILWGETREMAVGFFTRRNKRLFMTAVLQNRCTWSTSREKGEMFFPRYFLARVMSAEVLSQFGVGVAYK